jgi:hypothetical protein
VIVVGPHGCGSAAASLGGTADSLIHQSDLPVMVASCHHATWVVTDHPAGDIQHVHA